MGYSTEFVGRFNLDRPLLPEHAAYLTQFNETRRMKRKSDHPNLKNDPVRLAAGLPVGAEGEFYVGATGFMGQDQCKSIADFKRSPSTQPSLWCQWVPTEDGTGIEWDGGEKFYEYTKWLTYIVDNFLRPWGYVLNGRVSFQGEQDDDRGEVVVVDNVVTREKLVELTDAQPGAL